MIRHALPTETPALVALGEATGIFGAGEADALLRRTLDALHGRELGSGHQVRVWADPVNSTLGGWVYFAPQDLAADAWELYWIGVAQSRHGRGVGTALLGYVKEHVARAGGRVLFVETSSLPPLARARQFYADRGFTICSGTPDHYGEGDDKLTFSKRL